MEVLDVGDRVVREAALVSQHIEGQQKEGEEDGKGGEE